jgi:hypothetical protein
MQSSHSGQATGAHKVACLLHLCSHATAARVTANYVHQSMKKNDIYGLHLKPDLKPNCVDFKDH